LPQLIRPRSEVPIVATATPFSITVGSGEPEDQLAPGNYPATLKAVVERTINVSGEDREVFEWTFEVATANDDGTPGEPIEVSGLSSRMTGPQSKTAAYLVALLGPAAVQPGATFTMNDLIGKACLIQTTLNKGGYAKVDGATPMPTTAAKRPTNRAAAAAAPVAVAADAAVDAGEAEGDDLPF
jgi:hypothetical protein